MRPPVHRLLHLRSLLPQTRWIITTATTTTATTGPTPSSCPIPTARHPSATSDPDIDPDFNSTPAVSLYASTHPPTPSQLTQSSHFFTHGERRLIFTTPRFRSTPLDSPFPEVAFLGRSNVGKSSLLNAVLGVRVDDQSFARTSARPGKTRLMCGFSVSGSVPTGGTDGRRRDPVRGELIGAGEGTRERAIKGQLVILDMPGYGHGSQREWGSEIVKYLVGRKQLRRVFLLIDAAHGPKPTDLALCALLRQNAVPHQLILSKVDSLVNLYHVDTPPLLDGGPTTSDGVSDPQKGKSREREEEKRKKSTGIDWKERRKGRKFQDTANRYLEMMVEGDGEGKSEVEAGMRGPVPGLLEDVMGVSVGVRNGRTLGRGKNGKAVVVGVDEVRWAILRACGMI